jgi:hypothetical protein
VFPVRYELDLYILFRRYSVFQGLNNEFDEKEDGEGKETQEK